MPNRLLREGFVDSESVVALSDWTHRVYSNLIVKVDDAGRYDARIEFLRSQLFPLGTNRRAEDFRKALEEMSLPKSGTGEPLPPLLENYEYDGKPFLQLMKVARCGKSTVSKYPWKDGSFKFDYVSRDTRDGVKEYVSTSIVDGVATPSLPHDTPSNRCLDSPPKTGTGTGTEANTAVVVAGDPVLMQVEKEAGWFLWQDLSPPERDNLIGLVREIGAERSVEILKPIPSLCRSERTLSRVRWAIKAFNGVKEKSRPKPAAQKLKDAPRKISNLPEITKKTA